jgi:hypothetical protein
MQRRLTGDQRKQVQRAYDALYSLYVYVSGRVELAEKLLAMLTHNTMDGLPYVEQPLTDEDARDRPWVMVRDREDQPWKGPHRFAAKCVDECYPYCVFSEDKTSVVEFNYCRLATPAEIAAAGLDTPDA